MESWTGAIGPIILLAVGAVLKWAGDVASSAWGERRKAIAHRESEDDLLHHSRRVLIDEVGRLRALCRDHNVPPSELGPLVVDPWEVHHHGG